MARINFNARALKPLVPASRSKRNPYEQEEIDADLSVLPADHAMTAADVRDYNAATGFMQDERNPFVTTAGGQTSWMGANQAAAGQAQQRAVARKARSKAGGMWTTSGAVPRAQTSGAFGATTYPFGSTSPNFDPDEWTVTTKKRKKTKRKTKKKSTSSKRWIIRATFTGAGGKKGKIERTLTARGVRSLRDALAKRKTATKIQILVRPPSKAFRKSPSGLNKTTAKKALTAMAKTLSVKSTSELAKRRTKVYKALTKKR